MLLKRYRVLDLTGPLGFLCGRILGDLGADVVKVEPSGGDPARKQHFSWLAYNANKRGITLDLEIEAGRRLLARLATTADFLLESFAPGTMDNWGLGYGDLRRKNPGLIFVSISPFGQQGPYRDFQGSDLEIMALSGAMSLAGQKDGEPLRVTVPQSHGWVGAEAAMGALTALMHRNATGRGQHVDVSAQVAVMAALAHAPAFWDLNRVNPRGAGEFLTGRSVHGATMRAFWQCKDGWLNFIIYGGSAGRQSNQQLVAWMDKHSLAPAWMKKIDWKTFEVTTITQEEVDRIEEPIGKFFATLTKAEFHEGVVKRGMLGYPVSTVQDIYADPQLESRGFWQELDGLKYPGGFAVVDGQRLSIERPAPNIGEHNREVFEELGLSSTEVTDARRGSHLGVQNYAVDGKQLEVLDIPARVARRLPIVMLHEGLGSVSHWKDFPARVAEETGARVFVYSRYGHGNSDRLAEPRDVSYMHHEAEVVLPEILKQAGIERPVLLGHSDGASIALIYAGKFPESPSGLILEAPHVFVEDLSIESIARAKAAYQTTDLPQKLGRYHQDVDSTFWGWNNIWLDPRYRSWNIEEYLGSIRCPVLVIQGEGDEYGTARQIEAIQAKAPHAQVLMLPNCKHAPHRDQPEATLARMKQFFSSL